MTALLALAWIVVLCLLAAFPERRPTTVAAPDPSRGLLAPDAYAREG